MDNLIKDEFEKEFRPEASWLRKGVHRLLPKNIRKLFFIFIIIISLALNLLTTVSIKYGIITLDVNSIKNIYSNSLFVQQSGSNNSMVLSTATSCLSRYCSDFKDDKWIGMDKFNPTQEDPLILKSPNSAILPGATMFYKEDVGNFIAKIFITPRSPSSANLVLTYGHLYRCILGDSDYEIISCQINQSYPKVPENWSYFDKEGNLHGRNKHFQKRPFQMNQEMEIKFEQKEDKDNTIISIKINEQVPAEWILPKNFQKRTKKEKVGIGLITTSYEDVQAVFKSFELDPNL